MPEDQNIENIPDSLTEPRAVAQQDKDAPIIDQAFAEQLLRASKVMWTRQYFWRLGWYMVFAFSLSLLANSKFIWLAIPLVLLAFSGFAYATFLSVTISRLFVKQDYKSVEAKLSNAFFWSTLYYPFTYWSYLQCTLAHVQLLITQGRGCELEALTRIYGAPLQSDTKTIAQPRKWVLVNNLAVAFLQQERYEESLALLDLAGPNARGKQAKALLAINTLLSCCCDNQIERAASLIDSFDRDFFKIPRMKCRFFICDAIVRVKTDDYDRAEHSLTEATEIAEKTKEPAELLALINDVYAQLRTRQERFEEADLHYKNSIDLYQKNINPSYLALSHILRQYSLFLKERNRNEESEKARGLSDLYKSAYREREKSIVEKIRGQFHQKRFFLLPTDVIILPAEDRQPLSLPLHETTSL